MQLLIIFYIIILGLEVYLGIRKTTPFGKSGIFFIIVGFILFEFFAHRNEMGIDVFSYSLLVLPMLALGTLLVIIDLIVRGVGKIIRKKTNI